MIALDIQGLTKQYATGAKALQGLSMRVEEGAMHALLGANGAGKTTTIGILTGLVRKSGGTATVLGHDLDAEPEVVRSLIGVVPQEFNFSIFETPFDICVTQAGFYGVPRQEAVTRVEALLKQLGLWEKRALPSRTLSGGMKRRLMIARALVHQPKILLLDEPTAGVDVELRRSMWEFLQTLNAQGTTILLTTHYLEEAEQLCQTASIIKQGTIVREGKMAELVASLDVKRFVFTTATPIASVSPIDGIVCKKIGDLEWDAELPQTGTVTALLAGLSAQGITVTDIRPRNNRLEELFLQTIS